MNQKPIIQKVVLGAAIIKDKESLIREVKEETGLNIKIIMPFSVFNYQIEKPEEIRDSVQINFLAKLLNKNQKVKLSSEHQNFAWIGKGEIDRYELSKNTKRVIKKAFELIKK